ncbi:DUF2066 domain-containing protein [Cellvibrio sp. ARAG 10.3]|uniref:DUF2066 domain-containing protein n=1 Tax=Cellvibrio sp. ARAG 10.3 TaxID=3451358 RepID=UPI003F48BC3F
MLRLLTFLLLSVCAVASVAEQVIQVYRAEALVTSQSQAERNNATRVSLGEVIWRVTGDSAALEHPSVRGALNQAQRYLYEYSYASTDEQLEVKGAPVRAIKLILKFSPQAIEKLLREARLPLWPANRPKLLVWQIMTDDAGTTHRVLADDARKALYDQAALRGLPLLLPMHDFEDNIALGSDSLWNMDEASIRAASERYKPDAILVGRYRQAADGLWRANWQLLHSSANQSFDTQAAETPSLFVQAINTTADYFARLYAITPSEGGSGAIVIRVGDVRDFATYKKVQRYLEGLGMVSRVELIMAQQDRLLLRLHAEGDLPLLLSTLELGKKLFPVVSESIPVQPVEAYRPPASSAGPDSGIADGSGSSEPGSFSQARGSLANPLVYRWQD